MRQFVLALFLFALGSGATAGPVGGTFRSIDGGEISLQDWRGRPVLVVNTASRCAFTGQYDDLQDLFDRYRDRGLIVLAVPSNDFLQELGSEEAVKNFCEVNFDLDLPMTAITSVRGAEAHPFYRAVRDQSGFVPGWNFNKILLGPDGQIVDTWGAMTDPASQKITRRIESLLN